MQNQSVFKSRMPNSLVTDPSSHEITLIYIVLFSFRMRIFSEILRMASTVVVIAIVIVIQIFTGKPLIFSGALVVVK